LDGIAPASRGVPQIEVTFDIDANGILSVTAKDKATNKQQSITISGASNLAKDEVERMVQEAEKNAAADKELKEKVEIKNQSDALIYQTKRQLEEMGKTEGLISKEEVNKVEELLTKLEGALKNEDFETMKALNKEIENYMKEIGEKVYSQSGASSNAGPDADFIDTNFSSEK